MLKFYRRFIKNAAQILAPLNTFLRYSKKNDKTKIHWNHETKQEFNQSKEKLAEATLLVNPADNAPLRLTTDACHIAIDGVLEQHINEVWQPLGFFSKKLNSAQKNYSTYDRKLLAIYESINFFRYMLEGRNFVV